MSIRDAQHKLRILYGLSQNEPTPNQIRKWTDRVRALMKRGLSSDNAGDRAPPEPTDHPMERQDFTGRPGKTTGLIPAHPHWNRTRMTWE